MDRVRKKYWTSANKQLDLFTEEDFDSNEEYEEVIDFCQAQHEILFKRLNQSDFRKSFHLKAKDVAYIQSKGWKTIRVHATNLIEKRLTPANLPNDGKQTPMRGHPVFIAQHATGCCCRRCLYNWHRITPDHDLSKEEREYVVGVLMGWMAREYNARRRDFNTDNKIGSVNCLSV